MSIGKAVTNTLSSGMTCVVYLFPRVPFLSRFPTRPAPAWPVWKTISIPRITVTWEALHYLIFWRILF